MYRERLWTMRQFAGFGSAEDTNQRFRYLLAQGQTGLSMAFDLPTLMGYDSDHPLSQGEVGKCGVAISSFADMEELFDRIPLANVTTSMTINSPAAAIWAMYLAVAEKQGADWKNISGTLQNDILKEYIAQKEYIYPPEPSMRLVIDAIEFGAQNTPKFNTISISGYHIREAGSTAIQELAFTLRDGYITSRGACGAAWTWMISCRSSRSSSTRTAISSKRWPSTARRAASGTRRCANVCLQEPAIVGLAISHADRGMLFHRATAEQQHGAYGDCKRWQACSAEHNRCIPIRSMKHGLCRPNSPPRSRLRTQQVIAHETGVTNTVDPSGGSYSVETLTNEVEHGAWDYIQQIDSLGGMVPAIERGYPQREIAEAPTGIRKRWTGKRKSSSASTNMSRRKSQSRYCRSRKPSLVASRAPPQTAARSDQARPSRGSLPRSAERAKAATISCRTSSNP